VQCTNMVYSHDPGYYSVIVVSFGLAHTPLGSADTKVMQCDIQMPNKDGYQTVREIREWEQANKHQRIPIIALSANVMSEGLEKSMEAGFDEYVTKPVSWKTLGRMLIDLVDPNPSKRKQSRGNKRS